MPNPQVENKEEWTVEEFNRHDRTLLVFYRPGEEQPAGSIILYPEEVSSWKNLITNLPKLPTQKNEPEKSGNLSNNQISQPGI